MKTLQKYGIYLVILVTTLTTYLLGAEGTIQKFPYRPYLGNTHCHTQYDDAQVDAATSRFSNEIKSPFSACSAANDRGLKIQLVTGHGEHLNHQEWQATQELMQQSYQELLGFVGIRGFELTSTGKEQWGISTFDPRDDIGGFGHLCVWGTNSWCATTQWDNGDPPTITNGLDEFYLWALDNAYDTIDKRLLVFGFNHPSLYDNGTHFNGFTPGGMIFANSNKKKTDCDLLKQMAATIEMSSSSFSAYGGYEGGGDGITPETSNEFWFHWALQMNWRLAPVASGDEHFGGYGKGPWTVFWLNPAKLGDYQSATSEVLNSLRARRVASTEDKNCLAQYYVKTESKGSYFMGSVLPMSYQDKENIDFYLQAKEGDEPIGKISLIEVKPNSVHKTAFDPNYPIINQKSYHGQTTRAVKSDTLCFYLKIEQKDGNLIYLPPVWIADPQPYLIARLCSRADMQNVIPQTFSRKFKKNQQPNIYLFYCLYHWPKVSKITIAYPKYSTTSEISTETLYAPDSFPYRLGRFPTDSMEKGNHQFVISIDGKEYLTIPFELE